MSGSGEATAVEQAKPWRDQSYTPPEGRVGNLTPEHQKVLDQFRDELKAEGVFVEGRMDDSYLLRYVPAIRYINETHSDFVFASRLWS